MKNKGQNTMTTKTQDYFDTINQIDTKMYEINEIIKKFNNSIDNDDFLSDMLDNFERHIFTNTKVKK
jgi:hypothetical protein